MNNTNSYGASLLKELVLSQKIKYWTGFLTNVLHIVEKISYLDT